MIGWCTHVSATSSHESVVQIIPSSQLRAPPEVQIPFWHWSLTVQNWLSSHTVPFGRLVPGVHVPPWHVSSPLHTRPSEQEVPSGRAVLPQPSRGSHAVTHAQFSSRQKA